ncbi:hypothetical protein CB0940_02314 [Cercospora beticola]|uniref:F-box domain-containing protein n=1 Tax=Cercospora beticola TaxID=122368 RepID=A0A2G5I4D9_CERBT|nr:hypothetical protein CB0940_02314 [Cercospora beticola]PIA99628.1 hypothetical protein CB0940_02314 [Cercospora beticola]WPA99437.1 hypothetical protein RHO25_004054 [Cercospora beticola]
MDFVPRNIWDVLPFSKNPGGQPSICQTCGQAGHIEDNHAAIPNPNAITTIQTLPPELMLNVLANLPAREIQGCRAVSKGFRELIDTPTNDAALLRTVQERYDGLADAEYLTGTPEEPSFLKFLFTYLARRGVWRSTEHTLRNIEIAVAFFAASASPAIRPLVHGEHVTMNGMHYDAPLHLFAWLNSVGAALVQAYIDTNLPYLTTTPDGWTPIMCDVTTIDRFLAIVDSTEACHDWRAEAEQWGLTSLSREQIRQWYLDIKARKEPKVPSQPPSASKSIGRNGLLHIPQSGDACLEIPKLVITTVRHWPQCPEVLEWDLDGFTCIRYGWLKSTELSDILGVTVPELDLGGAYCIRSTWAAMTLFKAKKGKTLTAWERAAILEELYVF